MRVLAFRHIAHEGAGRIQDVLRARGIGMEYVDLYRDGAQVPNPAGAAGLIVLGGPMSANDDLPYLRQEMRIIGDARERGQPILGICLGAQLVARAAGARVYRNRSKEIGWFDVHLTEAAAADPLFAGAGRSETVFHWHGETFDLPPAATWLAYSERCRHQAFRLGASVYGLQFHLEVTPEMIAGWCLEDANCGDVRELGSPPDPWREAERLRALSELIFGGWCDLL